ncbi:hypothetical protein ACJZL1_06430 [Wolbachia endosymbiont of Rhagoletis indifferens]|uniref:hypothetical protein n=1 Tax=Wolbachia endosymbiont of Rhagoletis indifferens TaxID=3383250 RepID=UPI003AF35D70
MTVRGGMMISSSSRYVLAGSAEIPRWYDVEAILLYSPTQLDSSVKHWNNIVYYVYITMFVQLCINYFCGTVCYSIFMLVLLKIIVF